MAYIELPIVIEGISQMMMHNAQLADPANRWTKAIKAITSKGSKKKTDADLIELQRLEFMGSLYLDENGRPFVPGENIEGMVRDGAKKSRQGKDSLCGVFCLSGGVLDYDGPKSAEKLWDSERFRDTRSVAVKTARVMRTRPIFPAGWRLSFTLTYDDSIVSVGDVRKWLDDAGDYVGLLEYRPRFGRFRVVDENENHGLGVARRG